MQKWKIQEICRIMYMSIIKREQNQYESNVKVQNIYLIVMIKNVIEI